MDPQRNGRAGRMLVVVGPSGAGKDSLMQYAADRLAGRVDVGFVRRVITRPASAGGEDHIAVSVAAFEEMAAAGRFAVFWRAHGLGYGIPVETVGAVARGRTLVANGSRAALAGFAAAYPGLEVVRISACRDCLAARLAARGRENLDDILARLARPEPPLPAGLIVHDIDNSGALAVAGEELLALIEAVGGTEERT